MLFNLTRIILWIAALVGTFFIIKKSEFVRKKLAFMLFIILWTLIISASAAFPPENLFISFKSPESVFHYTCSSDINEIVYGQDSCLIVYTRGNSTSGQYIIPKTAKGYKIPNFFTVQKKSHQFDEYGLFDVYHVEGTQDYYVFGTVRLREENNEIQLYNEAGEKVESKLFRIENSDFLFFFINDSPDGYCLSINGEKVMISG